MRVYIYIVDRFIYLLDCIFVIFSSDITKIQVEMRDLTEFEEEQIVVTIYRHTTCHILSQNTRG